MKYPPLVLALLLVGCSDSPTYDFVTARNFYFEDGTIGGTPITDKLDVINRELKAIKYELTGVDTGCRFEVEERSPCLCHGEEIPIDWLGGCGCPAREGVSGLRLQERDYVETICKGDTKTVDAYSVDPQKIKIRYEECLGDECNPPDQ